MIERTNQMRESIQSVEMKFLNRLAGGKIKDMRFWVVVAVTIVALFLFWSGALVYAYVADDRSQLPADERSVPAPRAY